VKAGVPPGSASASDWWPDWVKETYEKLMPRGKNPQQDPQQDEAVTFGDHYAKLTYSKDPLDQARAKELRGLGDALFPQLLKRYPELAVPTSNLRNLPPERNGFLKLLEFCERRKADPAQAGAQNIADPDWRKEIFDHFRGKSPWNANSVAKWLAALQPQLDEIRTIGLMPEQSVNGIDIGQRLGMLVSLRHDADMLLLDAHLAAENGHIARALDSVRAASGIARHLGDVETPSLVATLVKMAIQERVGNYTINAIMPAVPQGQLDPAAWDRAVNPTVPTPDEFARIMKVEWSVATRERLLPSIADVEDPKYPPDPEALLDFNAGIVLDAVTAYEGRSLADLPSISIIGFPDDRHLSRESRELSKTLSKSLQAWRERWERSVAATAMTQAAFDIMNGKPVPPDPIHGLPYRWDPAKRELSAPDDPAFKEFRLKPLIVPKP
jgi:hypothetical protein